MLGTWAGLRPLVRDAGSERTADLSRRHRVSPSSSGMVTVTGGKLTTYREMAADTVDVVLERVLGVKVLERVTKHSRTRHLPLRGAEGYEELMTSASTAGRIGAETARPPGQPLRRRGAHARRHDRARPLARPKPLVPGLPYLRAEAALRRALRDGAHGRRHACRGAPGRGCWPETTRPRAADAVAELVADDLGWDSSECAAQVQAYRDLVTAERTAADLPETALEASALVSTPASGGSDPRPSESD